MALSGTIYTNVNSHWRLQLEWTATQNITNNTSTVTAKLYWMGLDQYGTTYSTATKDGGVYIDGTWSYFSGASLAKLTGAEKKLIHTYTKTVTHNSDGTKSISMGGFFDVELTLSGTYYGRVSLTTTTFTLTTIPRASSLTGGQSWTAGNNTTFSISRASSSFTHTVKVYVDGVYIKSITGVGTSTSSSFTEAQNTTIFTELAQLASKGTSIILDTYSGSTLIGSKTYTGTVTAPNASITDTAFDHYIYVDQTIDVGITSYHSSFTHTVRMKLGSYTKTITGVGTATSWTPSASEQQSLYSQMPNDTVMGGSIEIDTFYNGVKVRTTTSALLQFYVRNSNPTFTVGGTYKDTNVTTTSITGNDQYIVQNNSTVEVRIPVANKATAINGATMSSYTATLNGVEIAQTYSSTADVVFSFGAVSAGVNVTLSIKAVDSRGNSTEWTKTVTVVAHTSPAMNRTATRLNSFENTTTLTLNGSISALSVAGIQKNAVTDAKYRYREKGIATWGAYANFTYTSSGATYTATNVILDLDNTKAYEIEFYVADKLKFSSQVVIVSSGQPVLFIDSGKKSIGVNQFPANNNSLEVTGNVYLKDSGSSSISTMSNLGDGSLRVTNANGYVDIAPKNTVYAHIYTDRPSFYFNKGATFVGETNVSGRLKTTNGIDTNFINIDSSADISATSINSGIRIGDDSSFNLKMDANEVIANNNGSPATLHLQTDGGTITMFNNAGNPLSFENGYIVNEAYILASLQNGWTNYSGVTGYQRAGYWKDKNGVVHLAGLIKGGTTTNGTVLFTMPLGYRPANQHINIVFGSGSGISSATRVDVLADGTVRGQTNLDAGWTSLAGISFKAEQ
jgi:hypothetical protein